MASTLAFPQKEHGSSQLRNSSASLFSRSSYISLSYLKTTALEVHNLFYGSLEDLDVDHLDSGRPRHIPEPLQRSTTRDISDIYEPNAGKELATIPFKTLIQYHNYENPWVTTSSRDVLTNVRSLGQKLNKIHLRPFTYLLGVSPARFHGAAKVWSDVVEVCENENFDGNRTSIVDHIVHVLLLPGFHKMNARPREKGLPSASVESLTTHYGPTAHPTFNVLPSVFHDSPLHFELRVLSRLSFNESGRVAYHRDFIDAKDLLSLIPGFKTVQWMASRASAQGLSWMSSLIAHASPANESEDSPTEEDFLYTMRRRSSTLDTIRESQRTRAPDTDRG